MKRHGLTPISSQILSPALLSDPITRDAVIIDSVFEQSERDLQWVKELGLNLRYILDTHVHADHITGSGKLREKTGAKTLLGTHAGVTCADIPARQGERLSLGENEIEIRETPGHTSGCLTFVVHTPSNTYAFTGDALLIRGCGRTDFQQGDAATLYRSVHNQIYTLPDSTIIYPGHDYRGNRVTTVAEEKKFNPRLNLAVTREMFVQIMANLHLPNPKYMDTAVPANLACGQQTKTMEVCQMSYREAAPSADLDLSKYRIVDVREPHEFTGELGHLKGAELVPLATLSEKAQQWPRHEQLLLVCRSGKRSGNACSLLSELGFTNITNLQGGMSGWPASRNNEVAR